VGRVAGDQKRSIVALQQVPAILNSFATTPLCYRDLRELIVGEAVVTLAKVRSVGLGRGAGVG
jgi:hypothetical protein